MKKNMDYIAERVLRIAALTVSITAIVQLALSQFTIRISRLSTAEQTGISLFAFIIFGLITVFAVSRMKDGTGAKLFAVLMNAITALAATWYLSMLFADEIFLRSTFYAMDPRTHIMEPLSTGGRIVASLPIVLIVTGTAIYYLAGLTILVTSLTMALKNGRKKPSE